MANPIVSINLVVLNGEKYIRHCLDSILVQSYPHELIEINILDNGSTDKTIAIIEEYLSRFAGLTDIKFTKSPRNLIMWVGHEELLKTTLGSYLVVLSVDVILEKDFVSRAIQKMEADPKLGAIQAKIYQYNISDLNPNSYNLEPKIIDTCGFELYRSRRIGNIGHGESDRGQFDQPKDIFGVEGAVPVLRTEALKSIKILGEITDHDMIWYGEDLDIAWRLRMAGWKQMYFPDVIAWHDRGTTKSHTRGSWFKYISRVGIRQQISIKKRRLEWRNSRWTRIKNDYIINMLKDFPFIIWREIEVLGYSILFEPGVLKEIPKFFWGIPRMLRKRREIMKQAKVTPAEIHAYFS